ncbi:universal stress protein [Aequorivita sp. H23M31]|uniref:Universal stress protein n=1 Tax=Aequorivita ciconiae TaxID=2494375 RepID=A0A410FZS2_9FLAO|nr:universal stress protein [Aequorivita sp. H23M31]QAA80518.1 universal stress protein [Aequorivita sp. H23M31]
MKNILMPTDFSENSLNAIRYAMDYFADIPVNFYILHILQKDESVKNEMSASYVDSTNDNQIVHNPASLLKEEIQNLQTLAKNPYHKFVPLLEQAILVEAIRKQISENEIDVVIMGTKGDLQSNYGEMGSHTYEVITKVKCPIMVIPENATFDGIKNIAFVTDYNCIYRNRVISTLSEALHLHRSPLRVLNIRSRNTALNTAQTDNKGFLHYFFKEIKHSFHFLENHNVENGIQDFVDTWEISMVAIVAKNLNFIQRLMLRPTSGGCNYHTEIPFLVLHE